MAILRLPPNLLLLARGGARALRPGRLRDRGPGRRPADAGDRRAPGPGGERRARCGGLVLRRALALAGLALARRRARCDRPRPGHVAGALRDRAARRGQPGRFLRGLLAVALVAGLVRPAARRRSIPWSSCAASSRRYGVEKWTTRPLRADSRAASRISVTTRLFSRDDRPDGWIAPRTTAARYRTRSSSGAAIDGDCAFPPAAGPPAGHAGIPLHRSACPVGRTPPGPCGRTASSTTPG